MEQNSLKQIQSLAFSQLQPSTYLQTSPYYYTRWVSSSPFINITGGLFGGDGGGGGGGTFNSAQFNIQPDFIMENNSKERTIKRTHSSAIRDKSGDRQASINKSVPHIFGSNEINSSSNNNNNNGWMQSGSLRENEKITQIQKIYNNNLPRSRQQQQHSHNKSPSHLYNTHTNAFFNPSQMQNSATTNQSANKKQRMNSNLSQSPNQQPLKKFYTSLHHHNIHGEKIVSSNVSSNTMEQNEPNELIEVQQNKAVYQEQLRLVRPPKTSDKRDSERNQQYHQIPQVKSALILPPPPQKRSSLQQQQNSAMTIVNKSTASILNSAGGSKFYQTEPNFHKKTQKRLLQFQKPPCKSQLIPIKELLSNDSLSSSNSLQSGRKYGVNQMGVITVNNRLNSRSNIVDENKQKWIKKESGDNPKKWNTNQEVGVTAAGGVITQKWNLGDGNNQKMTEVNIKSKWISSEINNQKQSKRSLENSNIDFNTKTLDVGEQRQEIEGEYLLNHDKQLSLSNSIIEDNDIKSDNLTTRNSSINTIASNNREEPQSSNKEDIYNYKVEMDVTQPKKKKDKNDFRKPPTELEVIQEQNREEEPKEVPANLLEQVQMIAQSRPKTSEGGRRRLRVKQKKQQEQLNISDNQQEIEEAKTQEKEIERKKRDTLDFSPLQCDTEKHNQQQNEENDESSLEQYYLNQNQFEEDYPIANPDTKKSLFRSQEQFFNKNDISKSNYNYGRPNSEQNQQQRTFNLYKQQTSNTLNQRNQSKEIPLEVHVQDANEDYVYQQQSDGVKKKVIKNLSSSEEHKIIIRHNKSAADNIRTKKCKNTSSNSNNNTNNKDSLSQKQSNSFKKQGESEKYFNPKDDVIEREIVELKTGLDSEFINLFASPLQ